LRDLRLRSYFLLYLVCIEDLCDTRFLITGAYCGVACNPTNASVCSAGSAIAVFAEADAIAGRGELALRREASAEVYANGLGLVVRMILDIGGGYSATCADTRCHGFAIANDAMAVTLCCAKTNR
jgi:hypothetical protein